MDVLVANSRVAGGFVRRHGLTGHLVLFGDAKVGVYFHQRHEAGVQIGSC